MRYPILLCQIVLILIQFGRCEKYERDAYEPDFEKVNGYSQRIKRADENEIQLLYEINAKWCEDDECNYGNMMADAIVFYAMWTLKWKDVPIGIYYNKQCKTECAPNLSEGNYSIDGFLKPFASFDDDLYKCDTSGEALANVLKTFEPEEKSMKRFHTSNLRVITTKEKDEWYISARCPSCLYGDYQQLKADESRSMITNSFIAKKLDCKNSVKGTIKDALKFYIETKKLLYPTEENRYWELTKQEIQQIKETDSASRRVYLKVMLSFQFFMLYYL